MGVETLPHDVELLDAVIYDPLPGRAQRILPEGLAGILEQVHDKGAMERYTPAPKAPRGQRQVRACQHKNSANDRIARLHIRSGIGPNLSHIRPGTVRHERARVTG